MDPDTIEQCFYGTATLGERGQVVIPAEARKECDIHPGDKLLVFRHAMHPRVLVLAKVGDVQQWLQQAERTLARLDDHLQRETLATTE